MSHPFLPRSLRVFATLVAALLTPAMGQTSDAKTDGEKSQAQLRFICASSLEPEQEVVLASRDAEGKWQEHGSVLLRASLVTEWMPATAGELHLALRQENALKSICQFTYPEASHRALVVLRANAENQTYEATVIDPEKLELGKASILILNFSTHRGLVVLGSKEEKIDAGQQLVTKPGLDENGMYQLTVSHLDADGKSVANYDRYVSLNPKARGMLFLLPDKTLGLKVLSLSLFEDE